MYTLLGAREKQSRDCIVKGRFSRFKQNWKLFDWCRAPFAHHPIHFMHAVYIMCVVIYPSSGSSCCGSLGCQVIGTNLHVQFQQETTSVENASPIPSESQFSSLLTVLFSSALMWAPLSDWKVPALFVVEALPLHKEFPNHNGILSHCCACTLSNVPIKMVLLLVIVLDQSLWFALLKRHFYRQPPL